MSAKHCRFPTTPAAKVCTTRYCYDQVLCLLAMEHRLMSERSGRGLATRQGSRRVREGFAKRSTLKTCVFSALALTSDLHYSARIVCLVVVEKWRPQIRGTITEYLGNLGYDRGRVHYMKQFAR